MIKPTVGRVVWFWPASRGVENRIKPEDPLAATIACVHDDSTVTLTVMQQNGQTAPAERVYLWQEEHVRLSPPQYRPSVGSFCEWMPYQKGQAAKVEQLEAAIKDGYTKP